MIIDSTSSSMMTVTMIKMSLPWRGSDSGCLDFLKASTLQIKTFFFLIQ